MQAKLQRLAAHQGRDADALAREALERFVNYADWVIKEVDKGSAQIARRKVLSHAQVGTRVEKLLARKQPRK